MAKIGRPARLEGEKYIRKTITLPPDLDRDIRTLMIKLGLDYSSMIRVLLRKVIREFVEEGYTGGNNEIEIEIDKKTNSPIES